MLKRYGVLFIIFLFVSVSNLISENLTLDTKGDGKIDRWLNVELDRDWKKLDVNKNNKPDESWFYVAKDNKIFFIISEEFDYAGKGKPDIWITNEINGKDINTVIKADSKASGKIDMITYKKSDNINMIKADNDQDGIFEVVSYFDDKGNKIKETVDSKPKKDGNFTDFYYYKNELIQKEELDSKFTGKIDMWLEFEYNPDNTLKQCIIMKDDNGDGKPDEWHYTDNKRRVIRIEKSTKCDGKIDQITDLKKDNKMNK